MTHTGPPTPRLYAGKLVVVVARCRACQHDRTLDLPDLVRKGRGDTPLLDLPLRCVQCGARGHDVTVSAVPARAY